MVARGVQGLVGAVLFAAAIVKAAEPTELIEAARFLLSIGPQSAWVFLVTAVAFEILLGSAMLAGLWVRRTLMVACVLSAVFLAWGASLEIMNAPVGCGCGTTRLLGLASTNRWASIGVSGGMFVVMGLCLLVIRPSSNNGVANENV